jgi:hypothetical protein
MRHLTRNEAIYLIEPDPVFIITTFRCLKIMYRYKHERYQQT